MSSSKKRQRRVTRSCKSDGLTCSFCDGEIPLEAEHFEIKPCGCGVHERCLLSGHVDRGASPLRCRRCETEVDSHQLVVGRMPEGGARQYSNTPKVIDDETMKNKLPLQFLIKEKMGDFKSAAANGDNASISVLYFATISSEANNDNKTGVHTV